MRMSPACTGRPPISRPIAPKRQASFIHLRQVMHSPSSGDSLNLTPMGQTAWHSWHWVHFDSLKVRRTILAFLKRAYQAPSGHVVRQKGRLAITLQIRKRIITVNFDQKSVPTIRWRSGCRKSMGIPASRVPAGQINLQNQGRPISNSLI